MYMPYTSFNFSVINLSDYVDKLMDEVLERREILPTYKDSRAELEPILAKTPKPVSSKYAKYDKAEVVAAHKSRFKILDSKQ